MTRDLVLGPIQLYEDYLDKDHSAGDQHYDNHTNNQGDIILPTLHPGYKIISDENIFMKKKNGNGIRPFLLAAPWLFSSPLQVP